MPEAAIIGNEKSQERAMHCREWGEGREKWYNRDDFKEGLEECKKKKSVFSKERGI